VTSIEIDRADPGFRAITTFDVSTPAAHVVRAVTTAFGGVSVISHADAWLTRAVTSTGPPAPDNELVDTDSESIAGSGVDQMRIPATVVATITAITTTTGTAEVTFRRIAILAVIEFDSRPQRRGHSAIPPSKRPHVPRSPPTPP